jgi:hypothetical protein
MRILALLPPLLVLAACGSAKGIATDSSPGSRSFALSGFDKVALKGSDDVRVITGGAFAVTATGPQSELDKLEIGVEGSTLNISRKKGWHIGWSKDGRSTLVTVTMPAISGAALVGSGDLSVDKAAGPKFEASLAGSGDFVLAAATLDALTAEIAGSGNMRLVGKTGSADISLAGSGDVEAAGLTATTADISVAGSGNVDLRATGTAKVSLMGSGDVTISGTSQCSISKLGSGEVTCKP